VLSPVRLIVGILVLPALPFLVAQAHAGHRPGFQEVRQVVRSAIPRFLGFYVIVTAMASPVILVLAYLLDRPEAVAPSPFAVLTARLLIIPLFGTLSAIAVAGMSLDKLNGLQSVVDAVQLSPTTSFSSFLWLFFCLS
jgi:hypothetical protein